MCHSALECGGSVAFSQENQEAVGAWDVLLEVIFDYFSDKIDR